MLEIEVPIAAVTDLFESDTIPKGLKRVAPGEATLEVSSVPMPGPEPQFAFDNAPIFTVVATIGNGVGVSLFASWLYDKLKTANIRRIKINRSFVEVTPEGLLRAVEATIEIEEQ